jgi:hypothetical protein
VAFQTAVCSENARRDLVIASALNGIDYLEVSADQTTLRLYFLKSIPLNGFGLPGAPQLVTIRGGVRIRNIEVTAVRRADEQLLEVDVSEPGDFSTYTLVIDSAALDPVFAQVDFSFKAACPNRFDCRPKQDCPPAVIDEPLIDYLAKDYASFRQALIDFLTTRVPDWTERHEADLLIALLEAVAYTGDHLSYFQDAVANEPYLQTARQRISVRRHARLIDYRMHDGASARTFVFFEIAGASGTIPAGTPVLSRIDRPLGPLVPPLPPVLPLAPAAVKLQALAVADAVFEVAVAANVVAAHNRIEIHTWGNRECCLPRGSTSVDLRGDLTATLENGDYLLFEEVLGPSTGLEPDADRAHRQVVRLTEVALTQDPVLTLALTRVTWAPADALRFPLCLSAVATDGVLDGTFIDNVSVARGNLALADHGRRVQDPWVPEDPATLGAEGIVASFRPFRVQLEEGPLAFRIPPPAPDAPAAELFTTDPGQALPQVTELQVSLNGAPQPGWQPIGPDLLSADPFLRRFVVETDNEGRALLRFGDNVFGEAPSNGSFLRASYRVGVGTSGNVGADALAHVFSDAALPAIVSIRNPLAAWGGIDPQPIEQVKQLAPAAFRAQQFRAVTEEDYARAAEKHPLVSKAVAQFRWTGSWHTVFISVDPKGQVEVTAELKRRIKDWVTRFTLAGYDLEIRPPKYVALDLEIDVCVDPEHFRFDVEQAVREALSSRRFVDGTLGFFHPDEFTFGEALYLSRLYKAIEDVEGVDSAIVRRFRRFDEHDPDPARPATAANIARGLVSIGGFEVLRLDDDPNFPENGTLRLHMRGGK